MKDEPNEFVKGLFWLSVVLSAVILALIGATPPDQLSTAWSWTADTCSAGLCLMIGATCFLCGMIFQSICNQIGKRP